MVPSGMQRSRTREEIAVKTVGTLETLRALSKILLGANVILAVLLLWLDSPMWWFNAGVAVYMLIVMKLRP